MVELGPSLSSKKHLIRLNCLIQRLLNHRRILVRRVVNFPQLLSFSYLFNYVLINLSLFGVVVKESHESYTCCDHDSANDDATNNLTSIICLHISLRLYFNS